MDYNGRMDTMTTALKKAIERDGRSLSAIARAGGMDKGQLSRFLRDERDIAISTADRIVSGLGVECRLVRQRGRTTKGR